MPPKVAWPIPRVKKAIKQAASNKASSKAKKAKAERAIALLRLLPQGTAKVISVARPERAACKVAVDPAKVDRKWAKVKEWAKEWGKAKVMEWAKAKAWAEIAAAHLKVEWAKVAEPVVRLAVVPEVLAVPGALVAPVAPVVVGKAAVATAVAVDLAKVEAKVGELLKVATTS